MKAFRRTILALLAGATVCVAAMAQQTYPSKPVKVVVPFPAGGVTDIGSRVVAEKLGQLLGQPFIIENRPGAGTKLGTDAAIKSPKDGYTLYFSNTSYAILPAIDPNAGYDPEKDLAPIGLVSTYGLALVVNSELPVKSLKEFIDYAKKNPGKVNYGSSGLGSGTHFAMEWLKSVTGTHMVHIPFRSTSLAVQEVAAGRLEVTMDGAVKPYVDSGKVKILAVTDTRRDPRFPDVPTVIEAGIPGYEQVSWLALFAPVGTPPEITSKLNKALADVAADPGVRSRLASLGMTPIAGSPADLQKQVRKDAQTYKKIAADLKIKLE